MQETLDKKNEIAMKMLHYFIVEKNYNPIIVQGPENEIWLENLDSDEYKIIRIVSNKIINKEQLSFDVFKTKNVVSKIKKKTLSFKMPVLSIFTDLDEKVEIPHHKEISFVNLEGAGDIESNQFLTKTFPDMKNKLSFNEEGVKLYMKITSEINKKNKKTADRTNNVFAVKPPNVTKLLIAINVLLYVLFLLSPYNMARILGVNSLSVFGAGQYYRLFTAMFAHANLLHLLVNMYSLYIIGSQIESFMGRSRYLIIYLFSGLMGSLLSIAMNDIYSISVGASGALFGLMGSLLYFGYHYRVYLSGALKSQIIPLITINLAFGFLVSGIDNFAHIGGLLGGITATMAVGVKYKSSKLERTNGLVISLILMAFFVYLAIVRLAT